VLARLLAADMYCVTIIKWQKKKKKKKTKKKKKKQKKQKKKKKHKKKKNKVLEEHVLHGGFNHFFVFVGEILVNKIQNHLPHQIPLTNILGWVRVCVCL
jgi:Na+/glutamate symporter